LSRCKDKTKAKMLLEMGSNIESKDKDGQTPLSWAARKGKSEALRVLTAAGANSY
jgi:ankyrin repeat protein